MRSSGFSLLWRRRFLPLFATQALGAINDNLFKNALVVLAIYRLTTLGPILVALAGGVFILPYALVSAIAGQLADKYEKSRLIRLAKYWEFGLMLLAAAGFLSGNIVALMLVLFGLGLQAAFFSPLKYGILPDHLPEPELVAGNGLIEAGTFLGILAGTIAGGVLMLLGHGALVVAIAGLAVALAGILAAHFIPKAPASAADLTIGWNIWRETRLVLQGAKANKPVWLAIWGISWFWALGSVVLAELPTIVRDNLHGGGHVITLLLVAFSVGIGLGSMLCGWFTRRLSALRLLAGAGFGMTVTLLVFAYSVTLASNLPNGPALFESGSGWLILAALVAMAACGGLYSVPLYVICQEKSAPSHRARMIAANNVMNAAAMVAAALAAAGLFALLRSGSEILIVAAIMNALVTVFVIRVFKNAQKNLRFG